MSQLRHTNHRIASWNVECGGHYGYDLSITPDPKPIEKVVSKIDPDTVCFSDVFGWSDKTLQDACLPEKFHQNGRSYFQPLEDKWLLSVEGQHMKEVGVALATTAEHENPETIDLAGRCGLKIVLDIGSYGLRVCSIYLNHAVEDKRIEQLESLASTLAYDKNEDIPTVIAGDLNAQEALSRVGWRERNWSKLVRLGALTFSKINHPYGPILHDLERRKALEVLEGEGFNNIATNEQRTALFPYARAFRVDHIYARDVEATDYTVHPIHSKASDHKPISATLRIP